MALTDDIQAIHETLTPKTVAHSIALRVMATMLQDVLGEQYDEHVDMALKTFGKLGSDEDPEFQQKLLEEFKFIFSSESE